MADRMSRPRFPIDLRREPGADVRRGLVRLAWPGQGVAQLPLERERVVRRRLDPHEETVERRDVRADGVVARLERLDERRP